MLQYKIPQDIGIEDKIVGPLSLRQLIIVAVGVGISYVIYAIAAKLYELNTLEYIVIALPALIAAAAAFIRINNISFTKFILLSLEYAIKPKKRLWDHRGIAHLVAPDLKEKKTGIAATVAEGKKRKDVDLDELSRILDSGGFENVKVAKHEDIDKAKDEDLVAEAYFGNKKSESPTENMYWRTKESHKKRLEMLAKLPITKKQEVSAPIKTVKTEQKTAPQPVPPVRSPGGPVQTAQPVKQQEPPVRTVSGPGGQPESQLAKPQPAKQPQKQPFAPVVPPKPVVQSPPAQTQKVAAKPETTKPPVSQAKPAVVERRPAQAPPAKPQFEPREASRSVTEAGEAGPRPKDRSTEQSDRPTGAKRQESQPVKTTETTPQKKPAEAVPATKPQITTPAPGTAKKKRRRNKKPKTLMPVRPETQINNTQKNKPVTLIPKEKAEAKPNIPQTDFKEAKNGQAPEPWKQEQPAPKEKPARTDQTGGEIHLEELKKGEITWGF